MDKINEDFLFKELEQYNTLGKFSDTLDLAKLPSLEIRLTGNKFHQSLTPSVMVGFIEMQKYINKSYALLRYKSSKERLRF